MRSSNYTRTSYLMALFAERYTSVDFAVVLQVALNSTTSDSAVDNVKDSFYINALHLSNNFDNK